MEDKDAVSPTVAATGFISGNETIYNYSDDDVVESEVEVARVASSW